MTLTTEQRSEINRRNGQKSQGPKTNEGKAKSRQNATKHGLRAELLAMPHEDPSIVNARTQSWNEYYQPSSPAAQHLVNECVRATIMSDRCHNFHDAMLAKQVREAEIRERARDEAEIERQVARLAADPENATEALHRFGAGIQYLISRWERLAAILEKHGTWNTSDCSEAIRLQGFRADDKQLKNSEVAWRTRFYNLLAFDHPDSQYFGWMVNPGTMPANLRSTYGRDSCPDRDDCRVALKEMVAEKLRHLRIAAAAHEEIDDANDASAADRSLILQDEPSAKLFLRYLAESRSTFHRSFKELVKTLDRDQAENVTPTAVSPNEPNLVAEEAVSPNEPNGEMDEESEETAQSDKSSGGVNTPAVVSPNEPNSRSVVEAAAGQVSASPSKQRAA